MKEKDKRPRSESALPTNDISKYTIDVDVSLMYHLFHHIIHQMWSYKCIYLYFLLIKTDCCETKTNVLANTSFTNDGKDADVEYELVYPHHEVKNDNTLKNHSSCTLENKDNITVTCNKTNNGKIICNMLLLTCLVKQSIQN